MRWVHLRINTRVRVLGRLGCTGAFTRRTEQHPRGPVISAFDLAFVWPSLGHADFHSA